MEYQIRSVQAFHELAGHPVGDIELQLITPRRSAQRCNWMEEELMEFNKAINERNLSEAFDALGDLLYFTFGTVVEMGGRVHMATFFEIIHRSNMSKFAHTEEQALRTIADYAEKGIKTHFEIKDAYDGTAPYYVIIFSEGEKAGKVAKCIDWVKPDYSAYFHPDGSVIQ